MWGLMAGMQAWPHLGMGQVVAFIVVQRQAQPALILHSQAQHQHTQSTRRQMRGCRSSLGSSVHGVQSDAQRNRGTQVRVAACCMRRPSSAHAHLAKVITHEVRVF